MSELRRRLLASIEHASRVTASLADQAEALETICRVVVDAVRGGGKVMTCGYGGSAADALHMAEELTGRFDRDRPSLPAIALTADPTLLTCIANDYGFDRVFSRQVEGHGKPRDVLVLFSTSGKAAGLRLAIEAAKPRHVTTIALLGKGGGPLKGLADHELIINDQTTARIQEAHTVILHLILEQVDAAVCGS